MPDAVGTRGAQPRPCRCRAGQVCCLPGTEPTEDQSNTEDPMLDPNVNAWMDEGFHCGMVQATDGADV